MNQIKDFQSGSYLQNQPLAVTNISEKTTRQNKPYLDITLSDPSGQIKAKVWEDAFNSVKLETGQVASITGRVGEYQGNIDITITSAYLLPEESFTNYLSQIPTMIFDIETVGQDFDGLGEWDQNYILQNLEKNTEEEEAKEKLGLYALYGFVQSIGIINPQTNQGTVLTLTNQTLTPENPKFEYITASTEKDLLEKFWNLTTNYQRFVTYNGIGFDWPFLIIRSGINRVTIPFEIDHYDKSKFIDLADKFKQGRQFKLEALCRAFGITNPKEKGVSGLHVTNLYQQNNHQAIADYVARDAVSTAELYNIWRTHLSGHLHF